MDLGKEPKTAASSAPRAKPISLSLPIPALTDPAFKRKFITEAIEHRKQLPTHVAQFLNHSLDQVAVKGFSRRPSRAPSANIIAALERQLYRSLDPPPVLPLVLAWLHLHTELASSLKNHVEANSLSIDGRDDSNPEAPNTAQTERETFLEKNPKYAALAKEVDLLLQLFPMGFASKIPGLPEENQPPLSPEPGNECLLTPTDSPASYLLKSLDTWLQELKDLPIDSPLWGEIDPLLHHALRLAENAKSRRTEVESLRSRLRENLAVLCRSLGQPLSSSWPATPESFFTIADVQQWSPSSLPYKDLQHLDTQVTRLHIEVDDWRLLMVQATTTRTEEVQRRERIADLEKAIERSVHSLRETFSRPIDLQSPPVTQDEEAASVAAPSHEAPSPIQHQGPDPAAPRPREYNVSPPVLPDLAPADIQPLIVPLDLASPILPMAPPLDGAKPHGPKEATSLQRLPQDSSKPVGKEQPLDTTQVLLLHPDLPAVEPPRMSRGPERQPDPYESSPVSPPPDAPGASAESSSHPQTSTTTPLAPLDDAPPASRPPTSFLPTSSAHDTSVTSPKKSAVRPPPRNSPNALSTTAPVTATNADSPKQSLTNHSPLPSPSSGLNSSKTRQTLPSVPPIIKCSQPPTSSPNGRPATRADSFPADSPPASSRPASLSAVPPPTTPRGSEPHLQATPNRTSSPAPVLKTSPFAHAPALNTHHTEFIHATNSIPEQAIPIARAIDHYCRQPETIGLAYPLSCHFHANYQPAPPLPTPQILTIAHLGLCNSRVEQHDTLHEVCKQAADQVAQHPAYQYPLFLATAPLVVIHGKAAPAYLFTQTRIKEPRFPGAGEAFAEIISDYWTHTQKPLTEISHLSLSTTNPGDLRDTHRTELLALLSQCKNMHFRFRLGNRYMRRAFPITGDGDFEWLAREMFRNEPSRRLCEWHETFDPDKYLDRATSTLSRTETIVGTCREAILSRLQTIHTLVHSWLRTFSVQEATRLNDYYRDPYLKLRDSLQTLSTERAANLESQWLARCLALFASALGL